jgi:hypothetical protein
MRYEDRFRRFILGLVSGSLFLALFFLFFGFVHNDQAPSKEAGSNFHIVDQYKGCDLLRWSEHSAATYKYVLYCPPVANPSK